MNAVLSEIYATILPSAPFIIAAYALVWFVLLVYVVYAMTRFKKVEAQIGLIEQTIASGGKTGDATASVLKEA